MKAYKLSRLDKEVYFGLAIGFAISVTILFFIAGIPTTVQGLIAYNFIASLGMLLGGLVGFLNDMEEEMNDHVDHVHTPV